MPFVNVVLTEVDAQTMELVDVTITLDDAAKGMLGNLGGFQMTTPGSYVLTNVTAAMASAQTRNLTFEPTNNRITVPESEITQFTISITDNKSSPFTDTHSGVTVTATNDPPEITGTRSGQTVYHRLSIRPFAGVVITEVDDLTLQPLIVTIELDNAANGVLTSLGSFTGDPESGVYSVSNITAADATLALNALEFMPTTDGRLPAGVSTSEVTRFTITVDDEFASPVVDANTTVEALNGFITKELAADGAANDALGAAVATTRDLMVVGAPLADARGNNSGAAYLFVRDYPNANQWGEFLKLEPSDGQGGDEFGFAVGISGDTIVIGARNDKTGATSPGSAYVFERNEGGADNWGEVTKLIPFDGESGDLYAYSVSISGDTIVIGAPRDDDLGGSSGSAYIYQRDQLDSYNWDLSKKILAADGQAADEFGFSVCIEQDTIAVGAHGNDDNGGGSGSAYVFGRDEGGSSNWGEVTKLLASDGAAGDEFGFSVGVSGHLVVVGAPFDAAPANGAGSAYVFQREPNNTWNEIHHLLAFDPLDEEIFGLSVAIDGNLVVIGAPGADASSTKSGMAYVFGQDHGGVNQWGLVEKLIPPRIDDNDDFGAAVAIRDHTVAIGAPNDNEGGTKFGAVYAYRLKFNNPPMLVNPIADQVAVLNAPFNFVVPSDTFADPDLDDDPLTLSAEAFPASTWLSFDPIAAAFTNVPNSLDTLTVVLTATDRDGASSTSTFAIIVTANQIIVSSAILSGDLPSLEINIDPQSGQVVASALISQADSCYQCLLEVSCDLVNWVSAADLGAEPVETTLVEGGMQEMSSQIDMDSWPHKAQFFRMRFVH